MGSRASLPWAFLAKGGLNVGQLECIALELLDVVQHVPDPVDWHLLQVVHPLINGLENALVLVGLADVADDVLAVAAVDAEHLRGLLLVLQLFEDLLVHCALDVRSPAARLLVDDAGQRDADHDQELLVDVEHQVLQVSVDTCLRINGGLLIRQQVVELHNANRDGLVLLRLEHNLFQDGVLDDLVGDNQREVACFSHVPPVVAVERGVQVVAQAL